MQLCFTGGAETENFHTPPQLGEFQIAQVAHSFLSPPLRSDTLPKLVSSAKIGLKRPAVRSLASLCNFA